MPYYPQMAYRMVSLEKPLAPGYGLGDVPASAWCSTANRQGACSPINGVCLPMNAATLSVFKDLQRQTNRILARASKSLIGVDGRIGPGLRREYRALCDGGLGRALGGWWRSRLAPHYG